MEWTEQNSTKRKPNDVFNFGYKLWVIREHFWFFIKAITIDKIHNNKKRHEGKKQPLIPEAWVHSQVSLSSNYGGCVAVGEICVNTSVICGQYQSTNAPEYFIHQW